MLCAIAVALFLQPAWHVDFVGKAGFGHVTRVLALDDRLIFLDSPPPTQSDGGDIYLWRDKDVKPIKVFSVQEQGARVVKKLGRLLVVPGIDAMESWDWGNWYLSRDLGESWVKHRNLPKAVHVFDFVQWRGKYYAGISDTAGAVISSQTGSEWKREFGEAAKGSFGEVLSLVPLPDALYAFWVEQWGAKNLEANQKVDCYRFDGKTWQPKKLLPGVNAVWNTKVFGSSALILLSGKSFMLSNGKAEPVAAVDGLTASDVMEYGKALLWLAAEPKKGWAVYRTPFDRAKGAIGQRVKLLDLPDKRTGHSLAVHGGRLFVGCAAPSSGELLSVDLEETIRLRPSR